MRSDAGTRAAGVLRALAGKAAALATLVALLLLAVSHVEIDHESGFAPVAGQQAVLLASAPCSSAAHGHASSGATECSAPCVAPISAAPVYDGVLARQSSPARPSCPAMNGVHVGFATPPPRIA